MTPATRATPRVIGIGEVLWDLLPAGKQLGGAPANFAYHAQQLGAVTAVVSAVGRDPLGDEILERLRELGIDTTFVAVDPKLPTGTVSVTLDAAGVPSYVIHENVAWDALAHTPALARAADVICFGTLAQRSPGARTAIHAYLREVRPEALRIFDINLRQQFYSRSIIENSLEASDVLKINDVEVEMITKMFEQRSETDLRRMLFEKYPLRLIAMTRGDKGSVLHPRDGQPHEHPGAPVTKLADTVGAGDAFTAALATGLLRGEPLDRINEAANRLAAYVCSQPGATPPIPAELRDSLWK